MKIYIEVYGCTANKADASLIKGILRENNFEIVRSINESDLIIILTCTVIDTTEQRILSRIKKLKETGKKIIVAGCMASVQQEKIKKILPNARFLPPQYSHNILDIIRNKDTNLTHKNKTFFQKYYEDIFAPISISEGCLFNCSYCITSIARGKLISFPEREIIKDIKNAIKNDCKEIQLTSQDTSSYGLDINTNLGVLLDKIKTIKGKFKLRVGMMNPYTCNNNLDSIICGYKDDRIYKFLHLPVQSGNDQILQKMNRKYKVNDFTNIIKKFRDNYPEISIATDIIVGFPTETDKQFKNTIDLIKTVKPDIINITKFSARPFTKAKSMKGRLKTEIVKNRSKILTNICSDISLDQNKKLIGNKYKILITEKGKNDTFVGRNENYKTIVLNQKVEIGTYNNVKIIDAESNYIVGSII